MAAPATPTTAHQEPELFDLTGVVRAWAINSFYAAADKKARKLKVPEIEFRLIWDDIVCWSEPPVFQDSNSVQLPKCHALFNSSYRNKTDGVQEYNFRTDRTTRSTAEIEISKGFTSHRELGVKLQVGGLCNIIISSFCVEVTSTYY